MRDNMIRLAEEKDILKIEDLLAQVHDVHYQIRPDIFKEGVNKYNESEIANILNDKNRPIFVYEKDGIVVGYVFCIIKIDDDKSHIYHKTLFIDDICVDKNYQRQNIGNILYEYVKAYAKKEGCYNITLNVWKNNESAEKFYEKLGMKVLKTTLEEIL